MCSLGGKQAQTVTTGLAIFAEIPRCDYQHPHGSLAGTSSETALHANSGSTAFILNRGGKGVSHFIFHGNLRKRRVCTHLKLGLRLHQQKRCVFQRPSHLVGHDKTPQRGGTHPTNTADTTKINGRQLSPAGEIKQQGNAVEGAYIRY